MIKLPFSCYCTELKVHPKNWQLQKTSLKKGWYVYYRFYDPNFLNDPKFKYGKLVVIKRMNQFKTIEDRQRDTKLIIAEETGKLKNQAYNPITNNCTEIVCPQIDISPPYRFYRCSYFTRKANFSFRLYKERYKEYSRVSI